MTAAAGNGGATRSLSVLTCVYEGSDPRLLRELTADLGRQTSSRFEWCLLAQGKLDPAQRAAVDAAGALPQARRVDSPRNLGIVPGLRRCLESATGSHAVVVDADDRVAPTMVDRLLEAFESSARPDLVFSDEDALVAGRHQHPWCRPGWDPVLNWATSYVWHAIAFDVRVARELGVWSDDRSNWCQDWDTMMRFAAGSGRIAHVPAVLYHWRAHAASQTHQSDPAAGSVASQRNVLECQLVRRGLADRVKVREFPLPRGGPTEWWLRWRTAPAARVALVRVGGTHGSELRAHGPACIERDLALPAADVLDVAGMLRAADGVDAVVVIGTGVEPAGDEWLDEALLLLALEPDLAVVAARIQDRAGRIVAGAELFGLGTVAADPFEGLDAHDPGHYALALKQRLVDCPVGRFFIADAGFLRSLSPDEIAAESLSDLGWWLGAAAAARGRGVACSPLLAGVDHCEPFAASAAARHRFSTRHRALAAGGPRTAAYRRLLGLAPLPASRRPLWRRLLGRPAPARSESN